jgi:hypothetical protein
VPDPIAAPASAVAIGAAAAPAALTWLGLTMGLPPPLLIAGGFGAAAAILFFDAVPSTGDTLLELARTFSKRLAFALVSAAFGAYAGAALGPAAQAMLPAAVPPDKLHALVALVVAGGAKALLSAWIERGVKASKGTAA